ncbi:MAG TPA: hypothetical protein DEP84_05730 [Chloroflexi bacterium]|nr:hypothetical protein [Chloroflexota bacterium]
MAKKRKKRQHQSGGAPKVSRASAPREVVLLQEALLVLRHGNTAPAIRLASQVLRAGGSPRVAEAAREVLAEAHFRAAINSPEPDERLKQLDEALQHTPEAPRLHFHRGVTLWRLGRLSEAVKEFDVTAKREPERPGLAYLRQLARLATGQSWQRDGMSPAEANTLRLVQGLLNGEPLSGLSSALRGPLLGKGPEMWQALIEMRTEPTAAPLDLLQTAAEKAGGDLVKRVIRYYWGVAAMRQGDNPDLARATWVGAQSAGLATPWLDQNLSRLLRGQVVELAQEGRWDDVVNRASRVPDVIEDRVLAETVGLAYYRLGYDAAQAGHWPTAVEHWRKAEEYISSRQLAQNLALAEEALENWVRAAEAWRDMVRRRPRKENHPEYLTDSQVAALWGHAADCYERANQPDEAVTCLKNAIKYAPDDAELRVKLVDALLAGERVEAAENELDRILEFDPQNVEALLRLGTLYEGSWNRDAMPIWRRVLAVDPQNREAREALAQGYVELVRPDTDRGWFAFLRYPSEKEKIKLIEEGLQELPEHPKLLLELGVLYRQAKKNRQARDALLRAYQATPTDVKIAGMVLHELLHVDAEEEAERLLPEVRQIQGLLPGFWLDQGRMVLDCELDEAWAVRFFDEAIALVEQPYVEETKASLLASIYETAYGEGAVKLAELYERRIRDEVPKSGAVEYVEAFRLYHEKHDQQKVQRLLRKAGQAARRANDAGMVELVESAEVLLSGPGLDLLKMLRTPGMEGLLENLLAGLDLDDEDEFDEYF